MAKPIRIDSNLIQRNSIDTPIVELNGHTLREVFEDGNLTKNLWTTNGTGTVVFENGYYKYTITNSAAYNGLNTSQIPNLLGKKIYHSINIIPSVDYSAPSYYFQRDNRYFWNDVYQMGVEKRYSSLLVSDGLNTTILYYSRGENNDIVYYRNHYIIDTTTLGIDQLTLERMDYWFNIYKQRKAASLMSENFFSGSLGKGWSLKTTPDNTSNLEVDNLLVRNTLRTHIFQKDVIKATNGQLYVSDSGVVDRIDESTSTIYFKKDKSATFSVNDQLKIKDVNDTGTIQTITLTISSVGAEADGAQAYTYTSAVNIAAVQSGMTAVRISGGAVLIDASTPNSPFIDVLSSGAVKARLGNLAGIAGASGYGLWSDNVFLTGKITASSGSIGNWQLVDGKLQDSSVSPKIILDATNGLITLNNTEGFNKGGVYLDKDGKFSLGRDQLNWNGSQLNVNGTIGGEISNISVGSIDISSRLSIDEDGIIANNGTETTFSLDSNTGNAYFKGHIEALSGTFSGELMAATGVFSGTLAASVITNIVSETDGLYDPLGSANAAQAAAIAAAQADATAKANAAQAAAELAAEADAAAKAAAAKLEAINAAAADATGKASDAQAAAIAAAEADATAKANTAQSAAETAAAADATAKAAAAKLEAIEAAEADATAKADAAQAAAIAAAQTDATTKANAAQAAAITAAEAEAAAKAAAAKLEAIEAAATDATGKASDAQAAAIAAAQEDATTKANAAQAAAEAAAAADATAKAAAAKLEAIEAAATDAQAKADAAQSNAITAAQEDATTKANAAQAAAISAAEADAAAKAAAAELAAINAAATDATGKANAAQAAAIAAAQADATAKAEAAQAAAIAAAEADAAAKAAAAQAAAIAYTEGYAVKLATQYDKVSIDSDGIKIWDTVGTNVGININSTGISTSDAGFVLNANNRTLTIGDVDNWLIWDANATPSLNIKGTIGGQISQMSLGELIVSDNLVMNQDGIFATDSLGNETFSLFANTGNAVFSGTVYAAAGEIGGWSINTGNLSTTGMTIDATNSKITVGTGVVIDGANSKITFGDTDYIQGNENFSLGNGNVTWNGTTLTINGSGSFSGAISAESGTIGSDSTAANRWQIGGKSIYKGKTALGTGSGIYIGTDGIALGSKTPEFKVLANGSLTATSATITGSITAKSGTIGSDATYKWIIGTNTTNASIYNGRSGYSAAEAGIYIGTDGIALGSATENAEFRVTKAGVLNATSATIEGEITAKSGRIGSTISGWDINENVLESKDDYIKLDAANNKIVVGDITLQGGVAATGTSYIGLRKAAFALNATPGIYFGIEANVPKFSMGTSTGNSISWNGYTLAVKGDLSASKGTFGTVAANKGNVVLGETDPLIVRNNSTVLMKLTAAGVLTLSGWTADSTSIYSGAKVANGTYAAAGAITIGSTGYVSTNQFIVKENGSAEFKGTLSAPSGDIGGWILSSTQLSNKLSNPTAVFHGDDTNPYLALGKMTYASDISGAFIGFTGGVAQMNLGDATNYMKWTGSMLDIKGSIGGEISEISVGSISISSRLSIDEDGIRANNGTEDTFSLDSNSGNAYFKGHIEATSGTFSGALQAATGTFSGTLTVGVNTSAIDHKYDSAGSANDAKAEAISTAADDATSKANAAISTAADDATSKANAAETAAKTHADTNDKIDGSVGGWTLSNTQIKSNSNAIVLDNSGFIGIGTNTYDTNGIFLGLDSSESRLSLKSSTNHLKWNGSMLDIKGNIGGQIGTMALGELVISSNLRINESGIFAENSEGATFSLFAASGNAFFKGHIEAASGTFGGSLSAVTGSFGALTVASGGSITLNGNGTDIVINNNGISGGNFLLSTVAATPSTIAGWTIASTSLYSGKTSITNTTAGVYIGTDGISLGTQGVAPQFKVTSAGELTATKGNIGGWQISGTQLANKASSPTAVLNGNSTNPYIALGKMSYADNTSGVFMGFTSGVTQARMSLGDANKYIRWTGTNLLVKGDIGGEIGSLNIGNPTPGNQGIGINYQGIRAYNGGTIPSFQISSAGDAIFRGTLESDTGRIGDLHITTESNLDNFNFSEVVASSSIGIGFKNLQTYGMGSNERTTKTFFNATRLQMSQYDPDQGYFGIAITSMGMRISSASDGEGGLDKRYVDYSYNGMSSNKGMLISSSEGMILEVGTGQKLEARRGSITHVIDTSGSSSSDISTKIVKKDIQDLDANLLQDFLSKVEVKTFYNMFTKSQEISLIIEDEEEKNNPFSETIFERRYIASFDTLPDYLKPYKGTETVVEKEDGTFAFNPKMIKTSSLSALILASAKANNQKIKDLEKENEDLKERMRKLERRMKRIEMILEGGK